MTRPEALDLLHQLAHGLAPDFAGCSRLLERISYAEDPELLRAVLTELGAEVLIDREVRTEDQGRRG